jgi:hypothetical protein
MDELKAYEPATYIVPAVVLWELDRLMSRTETRDSARAALRALETLVKRGAATTEVTCGRTASLRVAQVGEEAKTEDLDRNLADDRVLATAVSQIGYSKVVVVTTEFAMYAKALSLGLDGEYLAQYASTLTVITRRERESMRLLWERILAANTPTAIARRSLAFLRLTVVQKLLEPVVATGEPTTVAFWVIKWREIEADLQKNSFLYESIRVRLGHRIPPDIDPSVRSFPLPYKPGRTIADSHRPESADERSIRMRSQEAAKEDAEDSIGEALFNGVRTIREYLEERVEDI